MAYSTTPIDINRGTSGITLPPELSQEVWAAAVEESAIMQMVPRIELPGPGLAIPVITGDAEADWIAESTEKHVSVATFDTAMMQPYKLSLIEPFSMEFRRDMGRVYDELARRLPAAIGRKFDKTIFDATAPGSNFDVLGNSTAVSITPTPPATVYDQLVTAYAALATAGVEPNGWVLSPQAIAYLLSAVDGDGRPMFINSAAEGTIRSLLGAPVIKSSHTYIAGTPNIVGYVADWSKARWGMVNPGITISISEEATINDGTNQINLWQRNMFALRVECELGFCLADANAFVQLTD